MAIMGNKAQGTCTNSLTHYLLACSKMFKNNYNTSKNLVKLGATLVSWFKQLTSEVLPAYHFRPLLVHMVKKKWGEGGRISNTHTDGHHNLKT